MALDPNIILGAQTVYPQFNPMNALQQASSMQAFQTQQRNALLAQKAQEKAEQVNALLGEKGAIDEKTGLIAAPALEKIYGIDASAGQKFTQNNQAIHTAESREELAGLQIDQAKSEIGMAQREAADEIVTEALDVYQAALKQPGATEAAALKAGQEVYTKGLQGLMKAHAINEDQLHTEFKPVEMMAKSKGFKAEKAAADKENREQKRLDITEKREAAAEERDKQRFALERDRIQKGEWQVMTDNATGTQFRYNATTGKATTLDGTVIQAPTSVGKLTGRAPTYAQMAAEAFKRDFKTANKREPTAQEILADQASGKGMARTQTLKAQMDYYSNETKALVPQYVQKVSALNAPQIKIFRDALIAGKTQMSDPAVSQALLAANAVAGAYARSLAPTGAGDAETRSHARDLLGITSQKDVKARGDQLLTEIAAIKESAQQSAQDSMVPMPTAQPAAAPTPQASLPPQAVAQLKAGHDTKFSNGQVWTLDVNGKPKRVK